MLGAGRGAGLGCGIGAVCDGSFVVAAGTHAPGNTNKWNTSKVEITSLFMHA